MLLGISGCSPQQPSQSAKEKTQSTGQSSGNDNGSSLSNNQSQNLGSGQNNSNSKSNQSNNQAGQSLGSGQNSSSDQNPGSSSNSKSGTSTGQTKMAPTTIKNALIDVSQSITTRVPLILPTSVPVTSGKYLTGTTHSETWYYQTHLFETTKPENINTKAASTGTSIATVEGTEYTSSNEAQNNISGYMNVKTSPGQTVNLGNGIQALSESGAGHTYLYWNEGRWCIRLSSPIDPQYQNKTYPDSKKLAENIVAYLQDHALPAPQKIGVITINNWNNSTLTTIQWQFHQMVYQVSSHDPFTALKVAVTMKLNQ